MPIHLPKDRDLDAWQIAIWNADEKELSRPQKLELMLILEGAFNCFDPFRVVGDLLANRSLWDGLIMTRGFPDEGKSPLGAHLHSDLIQLRDVASYWNVETMFILHDSKDTDALKALASNWSADDVNVIDGKDRDSLLGSWGGNDSSAILHLWWD